MISPKIPEHTQKYLKINEMSLYVTYVHGRWIQSDIRNRRELRLSQRRKNIVKVPKITMNVV